MPTEAEHSEAEFTPSEDEGRSGGDDGIELPRALQVLRISNTWFADLCPSSA